RTITRIYRTIDPAEGRGVGGHHRDRLRAADHRREPLRIYGQCSYGVGAGTERSNAAAEAPAAVGITRIIERGGHIRTRAAQGGMAAHTAIDEHIDSCHGSAVVLVCPAAQALSLPDALPICRTITRIYRTIDPAEGQVIN